VEVEGVLLMLRLRTNGLLGIYRLTLQMPQATVHSSLVADAWLA
jgi:hypothetical protein